MKILIVEDDATLSGALHKALDGAGLLCDIAADGEEAVHLGETGAYAAAVLDLGLPEIDGVGVLRAWRSKNITLPVLVLTARGRWPEKRQAFNAGADDYLTKPFEMEEVIVRLRALLRRSAGYASPKLRCGEIELDTRTSKVVVANQPVILTSLEYKILECLMHRRDEVITRLSLIDHVYGEDGDPDSNVLDVMIARLRKKVGSDSIETVRGRGYRMSGAGGQSKQTTT